MNEARPNLLAVYEKLGEIGATVREVKHATNNNSAKIDVLANLVAAQGEVRSTVERVERRQEINETRIDALEADKHRREGAINLGEWILRHWPFPMLAGILSVVILWSNGKLGL